MPYAPYWYEGSRTQTVFQTYSWKTWSGRAMTAGTVAALLIVWGIFAIHQTHTRTMTVCGVTPAGSDYTVYTASDGAYVITSSYWPGSVDTHPADRYDPIRIAGVPGTFRVHYIGYRGLWGYPNILRASRVADDVGAIQKCRTTGGVGFGPHHPAPPL